MELESIKYALEASTTSHSHTHKVDREQTIPINLFDISARVPQIEREHLAARCKERTCIYTKVRRKHLKKKEEDIYNEAKSTVPSFSQHSQETPCFRLGVKEPLF